MSPAIHEKQKVIPFLFFNDFLQTNPFTKHLNEKHSRFSHHECYYTNF